MQQENAHLCVTRIVYLTSRFHDTMRLVSNGSQMLTSKCGKNKVANEAQLSALLMMLQHSDVFCHLLLDRSTATWTLFVLECLRKKQNVVNGDVVRASVL